MRKSPKNLPEGKAPLGTPLGGHYHPPSGDKRRSPQKREALRAARKPHNHLPSHGLAAGSVTPGKTRGEKKTDLPTQLKVANRSFVVAESSPARDGAQRSEREKGGGHAPGDSKGRSPWRAFGDFPRDGKVTRVQGGAPASGVAGATSPAKTPGARGGAPSARQAVGPRTKPMRELGAGSACPGLDFFHRIGYNILDQQSLKGRCGQ